MLFGVKFLLFLHIAAVSMLLVKPGTPPEKRTRMLTGLAGLGVVAGSVLGTLGVAVAMSAMARRVGTVTLLVGAFTLCLRRLQSGQISAQS